MRSTKHFIDKASKVAGLFLAGLLLGALPALAAPPIKVTSAVPDTGEQGTVSLVVRVGGDNFGGDSRVAFYVTGTTDPGGIVVKNVRWINAKALDATIDIAPDAQTTLKFDVVVQSGSRTGKGTELFKVTEKVVGSDTTPPGDVADLAVSAIEPTAAVVTWTAPADDGFDPSSGPAAGARVRVRAGEPVTPEYWADENDPLNLGWYLSTTTAPASGNPGDLVTLRMVPLLPDTTFWVAVRYYDERDNWSALSLDNQLSFTTAPFVPAGWLAEEVDTCPAGSPSGIGNLDLAFDATGRPASLFGKSCERISEGQRYLALRSAPGIWSLETLPAIVSTAWGTDDLAFDPITGEATVVTSDRRSPRAKNAVLFLRRTGPSTWSTEIVESRGAGPAGLAYCGPDPVVAYRLIQGPAEIRIARRLGASWEKHAFPYPGTSNPGFQISIACDPESNRIAVAHREAPDGLGNREALFVSIWDGTGWQHEEVHRAAVDSYGGLSPSLVWDSSRGTFAVVFSHITYTTWWGWAEFCRRAVDGSLPLWSCETVAATPETMAGDTDLLVGVDGTEHLTYVVDYTVLMYATRTANSSVWSEAEVVDWDSDNGTGFALDPLTGAVALSHYSPRRPAPALRFLEKLP